MLEVMCAMDGREVVVLALAGAGCIVDAGSMPTEGRRGGGGGVISDDR